MFISYSLNIVHVVAPLLQFPNVASIASTGGNRIMLACNPHASSLQEKKKRVILLYKPQLDAPWLPFTASAMKYQCSVLGDTTLKPLIVPKLVTHLFPQDGLKSSRRACSMRSPSDFDVDVEPGLDQC